MRSIERLYVMALVLLPAPSLLVVNHAAAQPARPGHARIMEVPDATLGQLRGRFTSQGQVVEFGVSMMSRWQLGSGEIFMATARLQVDLSNGLSQPKIVFVPNLTVLNPATAGVGSPNIVVSGAGTNRIGGLAQLIQVAGDGNDVINQAALLITSQPFINSSAGNGDGISEMVQNSPSGATLQAAIHHGGMRVEIDAPGFGVVSQQIRGAGLSGGDTPGILQRVLIAGDMHRVHNLLDISVRVAPNATLGAAGTVRPDLSMLHGLRHAGLF